jgi:hypothetical protein
MRKIEIDGSVSERMEFPTLLQSSLKQLFIASSISRIFCPEDLKEFIFRSMLQFPELEFEKNYFEKGYLLSIQKDNDSISLDLNELHTLIGLDFTDFVAYNSRTYWFETIENCYKNAVILAFFSDAPLGFNSSYECVDGDLSLQKSVDFRNFKGPDEDAITKAEKFSSFIVSQIDTKIFTELYNSQKEYIDTCTEKYPLITEYKERIYPDFDFELVPESTKEAIISAILTSLIPEIETIIRENIYHFTKFIWIVANDFYDIDPEEQIIFARKYNCDDEYTSDIIYDILGFFTLTNYYDYGFDEPHELLKGLYKAV